MAARPQSPRLPWETDVSTRWTGAGEDGGVLWSGGFYVCNIMFTTQRQTGILSSLFLFQLYSLFLTAAAGHLTAGQNCAATWADAMHAGTQAIKR